MSRSPRPRQWTGLAACAFLLWHPPLASAHLVTTGMGPVYDGIGHLVVSPEDLVPALALACYAGLRGAPASRRAMFLLPLAWLLGGLTGSVLHVAGSLQIAAASFLILGGLVAADLPVPSVMVAGIAIALGLSHGLLNGIALREGAGMPGLIGIASTLFVLVSLTSAVVVSLRQPWARVAVRVAGSWMAATGLLMFGWALRQG